jgi:dTDP-4-dehydrorhamnose reductase
MSKRTAAIIGGKGMLGTDLRAALLKRDHNVVIWDRPDWDIVVPGTLKQAVDSADVIVNCAAYTNVDGAETAEETAWAVNAIAVGELGRLAALSDKYVVHISTDFVYDGTKDGCYTEEDTPNPINIYGASKYQGEMLLTASKCRCCILRIEWTYGHAGVNFITKLCRRAGELDQLSVVADQIGSPTHTADVAEVICDLVKSEIEDLFLYASEGYATRYEVAQFIAERMGLDTRINPVTTADFPSPAMRPLNSRFDCTKIEGALPLLRRSNWSLGLGRFLEEMK